jgi:hypothetical protein
MNLRILGPVDANLIKGISEISEHMPLIVDSTGRVPVLRILHENKSSDGDIILIITARDLALKGCQSLFGFSDKRYQVAIVSTYLLENKSERLMNVIAHETGHLQGLKHCRTDGCVMRPARTIQELDARRLLPCERCHRPKPWQRGLLAAIIIIAFVFAGLDFVGGLIKPKFQPFSWRSQDGIVKVFYKGQPIITINNYNKYGTEQRMAAFSHRLNDLFADINPPALKVATPGSNKVFILAGETKIFELQSSDVDGQPPLNTAIKLVDKIEPLLRGKGLESDGCPSCHIRRLPEVQEVIRNKGKWKW